MSDSSLAMPSHSDDSESNSLPLSGDPKVNDRSPQSQKGARGGYLVLESAGRWSDVYRLSPPAEIILGRSSANDIAIRSEKASRQHARIWSTSSGWMIQDLSSRNGTTVQGQRISEPVELCDQDRIEIAGFSIQFVHQIQSAEGPIAAPLPAGATEDHLTLAMESASVTDRLSKSELLHSDPLVGDSFGHDSSSTGNRLPIGVSSLGAHSTQGSSRGDSLRGRDVIRQQDQLRMERARASLLQLAFDLAGTESAAAAIDLALDRLATVIPLRSAGAFIVDPQARKEQSKGNVLQPGNLQLVATCQAADASIGTTSYRRPADDAIASVIGPDGQAILARNVAGDRSLATENSQGEIDAVSMILAPVRDREQSLLGMLHLLTTDSEATFSVQDLEIALAVAEILAESLRNHRVRGKLDRSLRRSQRQIKTLQEQIGGKVQIVGQSDAVRDIIEKVSLAAPTGATVLVRGESGVGKELVAAAIHHASQRASAPLVCLNCAALSPSLLESELFGHEKGAFTGATDRKQGKFEAADGGTLMLDEIGEMDAEIQAKFLRVLEGHPFERVGGQTPIKVDVRVVAATNRDLQAMVAEGKFRQDLFYRLHVVEILVPPLRNRGDDILLLAEHFLNQFNEQMGRRITTISEPARKKLLDYHWPGNIRELRNVIERAVVLNSGTTLEADQLLLTPAVSSDGPTESNVAVGTAVEISLADLERGHIERVLRHTSGNKSRAAAILGIERSTLDRKLKKFAQSN